MARLWEAWKQARCFLFFILEDNMENNLEKFGMFAEEILKRLKLGDFYNKSEPLKHAIAITYLLHQVINITDKRELEHLKVDLKHHVDSYREEFEKLGINISECLDFQVK
ncbi:MAG: hypothetical protein ACTTIZ_05525 [Treponema sp.]